MRAIITRTAKLDPSPCRVELDSFVNKCSQQRKDRFPLAVSVQLSSAALVSSVCSQSPSSRVCVVLFLSMADSHSVRCHGEMMQREKRIHSCNLPQVHCDHRTSSAGMCNYFTGCASAVSSVPLSRAPLCALQRAHILLYSDEHDVRPRAAEARAAFMSDAYIHAVRNET